MKYSDSESWGDDTIPTPAYVQEKEGCLICSQCMRAFRATIRTELYREMAFYGGRRNGTGSSSYYSYRISTLEWEGHRISINTDAPKKEQRRQSQLGVISSHQNDSFYPQFRFTFLCKGCTKERCAWRGTRLVHNPKSEWDFPGHKAYPDDPFAD